MSSSIFILWTLSIIFMYYSKTYSNIDHLESSTWYSGYLILIWVIYGIYKGVSIWFGWKKLSLNLWKILGLIFLHILILSFVYSWFPEIRQSPFMQWNWVNWFTLFFHICQLLLYPMLLIFITRSVWYSLISILIKEWKDIDIRLRVPAEITLGFFIFVIGLLIIGSIGLYTLSGLMCVLAIMWIIGYTWHKESFKDIKEYKVELVNHELGWSLEKAINLKLISIEFWFFFLTLLLGVALINAIRPMPIGWDDLGVYMNFPKIMASTWYLLEWSGMYAWQLITWTGFLFSYTAAQAFYINQLGGILAVIAIISTLSYAFEKKGSYTMISLPILFAAIYYAMPMTVFQQAKDMKLDPAYLFFAISWIMLLFHWWRDWNKKHNFQILSIVWIIIGFTFMVKFTSLMLILWALWVISYRYLWFLWYIWYFFSFLAIFTKLQLWGMMNVPMPKDNPEIINQISWVLLLIGIISIVLSLYVKRSAVQEKKLSWWILSSLVFLFSVVLWCAPWLIKNIWEIWLTQLHKASITPILYGSWGATIYPYENLVTTEELAAKKLSESESMTKDGKTENEDLWRYFWYESWLNNYLKLPANLTFQKNQSGEFTDITYLFLALVPGLLLFVRGKRPYTTLAWMGAIIWLMTYYYFMQKSSMKITEFLGNFSLLIEPGNWKSYWYAFLILLNIAILSFFHFATAHNDDNKKLREIIMFMGIYGFLFIIAAFWIVWYGIIVYFAFFLIMGYSALSFITHEDNEDDSEVISKFTLSVILFIFIATYFIRSAFPHWWNNLKSAYYNEYKYNTLTQEESIFAYRSDYLVPIATMNLKSIPKIFDSIENEMKSPQMKDFLAKTNIRELPLDTIHGALIMKYRTVKDDAFRNDVKKLWQHIYSQVLYPPKDNQNMWWIYRIGTFMTYLINENRKRYLDDSLLTVFGDYFYDPSPEKAITKMKSLGLKYLLVDLNAATIDKDPRHALTERAEKLLLTMNAPNLRLVSTDNFCIELALWERRKGKLQTNDEFINIAGTNFESYRQWVTVYRNEKMWKCHEYILSIIREDRSAEYPVIDAIKDEVISTNSSKNPQQLQAILLKYAGQSWFALFEIIDTPSVPSDITESSSNSGGTQSGSIIKK